MTAPHRERELARLAALRRYHILDTPAEEAFDDATPLASEICNTPIALVSLIDEHRQWFKSKRGITATETPRSIAFCSHAIQGDSLFVVEDASEDLRFAANPLVTGELGMRFYAGAPLFDSDGFGLGTVCVIDRQPRTLTRTQGAMLAAVSRQVSKLIEYRKLADDLKNALDDVRQLNELLPTCAWCRYVRDDDGYWGDVSDYLRKHAAVRTTHGICPKCVAEQFPESDGANEAAGNPARTA